MNIITDKISGRKRNKPLKNYSGLKFGLLTAVSLYERSDKNRHKWIFKCDCGNEAIINIKSVTSGHTTSCGCVFKNMLIDRNTIHGLSKIYPLSYRTWKDMRQRCNNPNNSDYQNYGGRGIKICERWNDFSCFVEDMGERPKGTTIDRIDVNNGYFKDNCRWENSVKQANNKTNNVFIDIDGVKKTLSEWCKIYQIDRTKVRYRINHGWPIHKAFNIETRN